MNIKKATYGDVDVTEILKHEIQNFGFVKASNDVFGDTKPNEIKNLIIYSDIKEIVIPEDKYFSLKTIGIVIVCTNSYFALGLRFVKKFNHYYRL